MKNDYLLIFCIFLNNFCPSEEDCGESCKITDCRGISKQEDCTNVELDDNSKVLCKWENDKCIENPNCGVNNYDLSKCSHYITSGINFICYSDGEKCAEANSCETVQVKNEGELYTICLEFPHCEPGNNSNCINKCNDITNQEKCKYAIKDGETVIKCKWNETASEGKKCQVDDYTEFKSCNDAINITDMTNEQCSKLKVREGNYCRKGPDGCIEFGDCDHTNNVEVEPEICKELTKPDDDSQCIPSDIGCKRDKVKCLDNSLYFYDKIKCEKLDISSEGYKCLSNGI